MGVVSLGTLRPLATEAQDIEFTALIRDTGAGIFLKVYGAADVSAEALAAIFEEAAKSLREISHTGE